MNASRIFMIGMKMKTLNTMFTTVLLSTLILRTMNIWMTIFTKFYVWTDRKDTSLSPNFLECNH